MRENFAGTLRALERDSVLPRWTVSLLVALLVLWTWWFLAARVTLYVTSARSRLEAEGLVRPLEFEVPGRIASVRVELNQAVTADELLFELDTQYLAYRLAGERGRRDATAVQLASLKAALVAQEAALLNDQGAAHAAKLEVLARLREATVKTTMATKEASRAESLFAQRMLSERERDEMGASVEQQRWAAKAIRTVAQRLDLDRLASAGDRRAAIERLHEQAAVAAASLSAAEASIGEIDGDMRRHQIRAPASGHIGELAGLRVGDRVDVGTRAGSLIPAGPLQVVALFAPAAALGRVRVGQGAHLRLDGFSWTEYGELEARVTGVANEPRDGQIRVELQLARPPLVRSGRQPPTLPLQHGLTGTTDIAIEDVSPALLVLRLAGLLAAPLTTP